MHADVAKENITVLEYDTRICQYAATNEAPLTQPRTYYMLTTHRTHLYTVGIKISSVLYISKGVDHETFEMLVII